MEHSLVQIDISSLKGLKRPENMICKGNLEKLNYMVTDTYFYDFQYLLPFGFIYAEDKFDSI
jgi:hypothetical protein